MRRYILMTAAWCALIFSCKKETPQTVYHLEKITGTFTGQLKIHWLHSTPTGMVNSDTAYNTSVTVNDLSDGHFSVTSSQFMWLDSAHVRYPFDTSFAVQPYGIYFSRNGDTIHINGLSGNSGYPHYDEFFVGHR